MLTLITGVNNVIVFLPAFVNEAYCDSKDDDDNEDGDKYRYLGVEKQV